MTTAECIELVVLAANHTDILTAEECVKLAERAEEALRDLRKEYGDAIPQERLQEWAALSEAHVKFCERARSAMRKA